jgi:hypothetical protein
MSAERMSIIFSHAIPRLTQLRSRRSLLSHREGADLDGRRLPPKRRNFTILSRNLPCTVRAQGCRPIHRCPIRVMAGTQ